jgi:thiosulfate/3-mercaptopyruvate sulfurtransferase
MIFPDNIFKYTSSMVKHIPSLAAGNSACVNLTDKAGETKVETGKNMTTYAKPEVLVETDWVKTNLGQPRIKLVEIDVDTKAYDAGHIPGAVGFNWQTQLQDQVRRDILSKEAFESLVGGAGMSPEDTVVVYGDNNNWFAAHGFWLFKLYGHKDVRLI